MKKVLLLFVMVFAFSLTQANNHAVVKTITSQNTTLQNSSMNILGLNMLTIPAVQLEAVTDIGILHFGHHAKKTKQPKTDKKSKANKTRHHRSERWGHHHNKKENKK